jgi:peptide-methionine (S)-S-oxide reductase
MAVQTRDDYQQRFSAAGYGAIATEIRIEKAFYFAETEHQQYLHKNPNGYCGLGGTGVTCYS